MNSVIGAKLKKAREAAGLSQQQLAEAIGTSQRQISNYVYGEIRREIGTKIRLSSLYVKRNGTEQIL